MLKTLDFSGIGELLDEALLALFLDICPRSQEPDSGGYTILTVNFVLVALNVLFSGVGD